MTTVQQVTVANHNTHWNFLTVKLINLINFLKISFALIGLLRDNEANNLNEITENKSS